MTENHDVSAWNELLSRIQCLGRLTLAYSGGIDSRFLAHAALQARVPVEMVHISGPHVAPAETRFALDWASAQGLEVTVLRLDPLVLPEVAAGGRERCYACKRFLFEQIMCVAGAKVCDGSNASDAALFRPGLRAVRELGVVSPLAESGLSKDAIRSLARSTGLARPDQQARACLLTRLPYGMFPDPCLLARLAEGERVVEDALRRAGHANQSFRLRVCESGGHELHLGPGIHSADVFRVLEEALQAAGFPCTPVRSMDSVSGYFDKKHGARGS